MSSLQTSMDYTRRRTNSDLTAAKSTVNSKNMPITRPTERSSLSLPNSPQKVTQFSCILPTQYEESTPSNEKSSPKKTLDSPRKTAVAQKSLPTTAPVYQNPVSIRRSNNQDTLSPIRNRSNTDPQFVCTTSSNLKQQTIGPINSERTSIHHHSQSSVPTKPKCLLPTTTSQPGYVTASKLFNMMGYGLQNQYLFMLAHYLYIIDCRPREKFNENHIVTAIHWEDALNGSVYISIVERFSEIVLYDDKGIFFNTTTEMRRVNNRFSSPGTRSCLTLSGGFESFSTFFPFLCTQIDIRSVVDREKYLTIYPSVIFENQLYLGTGIQATNWKIVRDLKLTHIINISTEHPCPFSEKVKYLHLQLEDMDDVPLQNHFDETIRFMDAAFKNTSARLLVHCNLGISRSSTIVLAYLMKLYNSTLIEAFKFLRHRRPIVSPNPGFLQQLLNFEQELFSHTYTDPNDPLFQ